MSIRETLSGATAERYAPDTVRGRHVVMNDGCYEVVVATWCAHRSGLTLALMPKPIAPELLCGISMCFPSTAIRSSTRQCPSREGGIAVENPFKIYGPFEVVKQKVADREHQKEFRSECEAKDETHYQLSQAKGLYLFSLRNEPNYNPQYVGMTERDFRTEVFNNKNMVMILDKLLGERGVLCLHLLAKPKEAQRGFSINVSDKELYWIEDFIQQMCRIKNPDLYNIGKSRFLLKAAIEGLTDNSTHRGKFPEHIRTFRNALGFDDL